MIDNEKNGDLRGARKAKEGKRGRERKGKRRKG